MTTLKQIQEENRKYIIKSDKAFHKYGKVWNDYTKETLEEQTEETQQTIHQLLNRGEND